MKAFSFACLLLTNTLHAQDISSTVSSWQNSREEFESKQEYLSNLVDQLRLESDDGYTRLTRLHDWILSSTEDQRTANGMLLMAIWREVATAEERAAFLSHEIKESTDPAEMRILGTYFEADIVNKKMASSASSDELDSNFGARKERFYDISHYQSPEVVDSSKLASLMFSKAPSLATFVYSKEAIPPEVRANIDKIQNLRYQAELPQNRSEVDPNLIQDLLIRLAEEDSRTIDAYIARVTFWITKTFPGVDISPQISSRFANAENQIFNFLRYSNRDDDLAEFSFDEFIPIAHIRHANQDSPAGLKREKNGLSPPVRSVAYRSTVEDAKKSGSNRFSLYAISVIVLIGICALVLFFYKRISRDV